MTFRVVRPRLALANAPPGCKTFRMPTTIHPTAIISPDAELGENVTVGPFAVIEGVVRLGPDCVVGPHVHLIGELTAGRGNRFHAGCVIGDAPQHLAYKGEPTRTVIGDHNTFREGFTVHRAMPIHHRTTAIGHRNLFMVNSHVAHDCLVGSDCVFANGAVIGGHVEVGDRAFLSGNTAVHQLCRVGRLAMVGGTSCISQDLPPFWICQGRINELHGVNVVGLRRAGVPQDEIAAIRQAYNLLNRSRMMIPEAVAEMESRYPTVAPIQELIRFIRGTKRGIITGHQDDRTSNPDV